MVDSPFGFSPTLSIQSHSRGTSFELWTLNLYPVYVLDPVSAAVCLYVTLNTDSLRA